MARMRQLDSRVAEYLALDFSDAMHDLAREHLGELASRITFVTRDFRTPAWTVGLPAPDAIITMQAVHETRHKRRALPLLVQARALLRPDGQLLYCDHYFEVGKKPGLMLDRASEVTLDVDAGFAGPPDSEYGE